MSDAMKRYEDITSHIAEILDKHEVLLERLVEEREELVQSLHGEMIELAEETGRPSAAHRLARACADRLKIDHSLVDYDRLLTDEPHRDYSVFWTNTRTVTLIVTLLVEAVRSNAAKEKA